MVLDKREVLRKMSMLGLQVTLSDPNLFELSLKKLGQETGVKTRVLRPLVFQIAFERDVAKGGPAVEAAHALVSHRFSELATRSPLPEAHARIAAEFGISPEQARSIVEARLKPPRWEITSSSRGVTVTKVVDPLTRGGFDRRARRKRRRW